MTSYQPDRLERVELLVENFINANTVNNERLNRIEALVEKNVEAINERLNRIEALAEKNVEAIDLLQQDIRRWDERYFQLSRDNISISRGILLTTGTVVVISAFAPAFKLLVSSFLGIAPQL